jgi:hypothetical protein
VERVENDPVDRVRAGAVAGAARALRSPVTSVATVGNGSRRVARVTLADGRVVAIKHFSTDAPAQTNAARVAATLRFLRDRGAHVPEPLAWGEDSECGWLAMEWVGDQSIDEALQNPNEHQPRAVEELGMGLIEAVATVEAAFAPLTNAGPPRDAVAMARQLLSPWIDEASSAIAWLVPTGDSLPSEIGFAQVGAAALASPLSVGPLDYHAGNAIVGRNGTRTTIIDLDHVGWDWPARRVAQYAFATGSGQAGGTFRSALVVPTVLDAAAGSLSLVHGGDVSAWRAEIRAHAIILVATAAWHLRQVLGGSAHPARAAAWHSVDERRASLRVLADQLLEDGPTVPRTELVRRGAGQGRADCDGT